MASNKIGFVLALDGEKEFTAQIRTANKEANALKTELKGLSEEYKENANSMEALQAKQNKLVDLQTRYQQAVDAAKTVQEQAKKIADEQAEKLQKLQKELDEASKAQKKMADTGDTSSDAYRAQADKVEELSNAVREQAQVETQARGKLADWNKTLQQNENRLNATSRELDQNGKYLDEAKASADGTAKSIDKFGKELSDAEKEAREFGDGVDDASKNTGGFGDALKGAATVAAGNLMSAGLSKAADIAKDAAKAMVEVGSSFEKAMSEVKAISGASGGDLDSMAEKAKALGAATKFSATEVAEGFKYMSLAGWDTNAMLSAIDGVVNLAAASEMELGEASDMVTDYLSAFGLEASYAGKMADEMAYAQANSNTTVALLGEAFGNSAAQAHTMGQSLETTTAILEAMANQGLKGSEAGTALNGVMSQIVQKMEDGKIAIGDTNVAVTDSQGNFRDLIDILADVEKATSGMTDEQKASAEAAIFNRTSLKGVNTILNEGMEKIRGYKEELEHADGAAADMAGTMQENLLGSVDKFKSAAAGLGTAIYDGIKEPLTGIVDFGTNILSGLTGFFDDADTSSSRAWADSVKASAQEAADAVEEMKNKVSSARESYESEEIAATKVKLLGDQLVSLMNTENRTATQTATMHSVIKELGGYIPEITSAYNEQTGILNMTTQAVKDLTKAQSDQMIENAKAKLASEAMNAMVEASTKLNTAIAESESSATKQEVWETYAEMLSDAVGAIDDATGTVDASTQQVQDAARYVGEAFRDEKISVTEYADALSKLPDASNLLTQAVKDQLITQERADEVQKLLTDDYKNILISLGEVVNMSLDLSDSQKTTSKTMEDYKETVKSLRPALEEWGLSYDDVLKELGLVETATGDIIRVQDQATEAASIAMPVVDGLAKSYDKEANAIKDGAGAWGEHDRRLTQAEYQQEAINKAISGTVDATEEAGEATEDLADDEDKLKEAEEKTAEAMKKHAEEQQKLHEEMDKYHASVKELNADIEKIGKEGIPGVSEYLANMHGQISEAIKSRDADTVTALQGTIDKSVEQIREGAESSGQAIEDAYSSIYEELKGEFQAIINPFEEWKEPEVPDISVEKMVENLTKQQEYLEQYEANLAIVRDHVGQEITPELMARIEEMGPEGAKALEHVVATLQQENADQLLHDLSDKWAEGLNYSDGISRSMGANITAYRTALGKIGSSSEEWNQLRANINQKFDGIDDNMKQELLTLVSTAQECGIRIPDGFADGILAGDYDLATATATMNGALQTSFAELLQVAQDAGIEIPEGVKEGIESADTSTVINAFSSLLNLLAESKVKDTAKETGENVADKYSEGVKSKQASAQQSAQTLTNAVIQTINALRPKFNMTGAESGTAYSTGVKSKTAQATSSGGALAQAGAQGAKAKAGAYISAGSGAGSAYATGVSSGRAQAQGAGAGLAKSAEEGAKSRGTSGFIQVGRESARGMAVGMREMYPSIEATAAEMVNRAIRSAKAKAVIKSPSHVFRDEVGYQISAGVAWGIEQGTPLAERAASDMALKTLKSASSWLSDYRSERFLSLNEEKWYWEQVARQVDKGTEAYRLLQEQMTKSMNFTAGTGRWMTLEGVGMNGMFSADWVRRMTGMSIEDWGKQYTRNFGVIQEAEESYDDYMGRVYERATEYISDLAELTDISAQDMVDMRVKLTALTYGTSSYTKSLKALAEAQRESVQEEQKTQQAELEHAIERQEYANSLFEKYLDERDEIVSGYYDKVKDRADEYYDAVADRQKDILSDFRLFEEWDSEGKTGDVLLKNLEQQVAGLAFYSEQMQALEQRGILSQELIDELREMGADQSANIYSLGQMSDADLARYQALYDERERLAREESERQNQALLDDSLKALKEYKDTAEQYLWDLFYAYRDQMQAYMTEMMGIADFTSTFWVKDGQMTGWLNDTENNKYNADKQIRELLERYGIVSGYDTSLSEIISRYAGAWNTDGMNSALLNEQVAGLNLNALQALNSALGQYYDSGQHITVDNSSQALSMAQMADAVTKLVALVSGMTVQLDTGVVAGALAPAISESLASESLTANGGLI